MEGVVFHSLDYAEAEEDTGLGLRIFEANGSLTGGFLDFATLDFAEYTALLGRINAVMEKRSPSCSALLAARKEAVEFNGRSKRSKINDQLRNEHPRAAEVLDDWAIQSLEYLYVLGYRRFSSFLEFLDQIGIRYYILPKFGVLIVQWNSGNQEVDNMGKEFAKILMHQLYRELEASQDSTLDILRPSSESPTLLQLRSEEPGNFNTLSCLRRHRVLTPFSHLRGDYWSLDAFYENKTFHGELIPPEVQIPTFVSADFSRTGKDLEAFVDALRADPSWGPVFKRYPWLVVKNPTGFQGRHVYPVRLRSQRSDFIQAGMNLGAHFPAVVQAFFPSKRRVSRNSTEHRYSGRYAQWLYLPSADSEKPRVLGEFCYRSLAPDPIVPKLKPRNFIGNHRFATLQKEDSSEAIDRLREIGKAVALRALRLTGDERSR